VQRLADLGCIGGKRGCEECRGKSRSPQESHAQSVSHIGNPSPFIIQSGAREAHPIASQENLCERSHIIGIAFSFSSSEKFPHRCCRLAKALAAKEE
jgi:hypothetical protein